MSDEHEPGGFLQGLIGMFGGDDDDEKAREPEAETGYAASAETLEELLSKLAEQAAERREAERRRRAVVSGRLSEMDKDDREEIKKERMDEIHALIRADVLATHARLGTGVDDAELARLDEFMHLMCDVMSAPASGGVELQIRASVTRRFFDETGPLAWDRLEELMEHTGIEWPASEGTDREHKHAEAEEMFVHASPVASSDLVAGVVSVWRDHYPQPKTPLWESVCLRAVGSGLRARMLHRGMEHLRVHGDELRSEGEALLREEITTLRQVLSSGVRSVAEADQVMAGAGGLLEKVLPDLCWERARDVVVTD
ncbi:MAG: hypothetical protein GY715_05700 [Planctomycetes bacterium]|nr:hypothetical protein [Planctomycetota bacterium]